MLKYNSEYNLHDLIKIISLCLKQVYKIYEYIVTSNAIYRTELKALKASLIHSVKQAELNYELTLLSNQRHLVCKI